ncbi:MAG: hypothetical protein IMZ75_10415, partial [Actinobacteria bacterium]|nr:hypothetical protein [Actinomycetota bacterium]
ANKYIETVGSHADSLHLAIKRVTASDIYSEYLKTVEILGNRFQLNEKAVVLAFDYTEGAPSKAQIRQLVKFQHEERLATAS